MTALVAVLTLLAPSVARVVCDVGCVQGAHAVAAAETDESCHQPSASRHHHVILEGSDQVCHGSNQAVTSSPATERQARHVALVAERAPQFGIVSPHGRLLADQKSSLSARNVPLITTQLRI